GTVGFSYARAVALIIALVIVYYAAFYLFLRAWLSSQALAAFGTLLAVKLQLFHWGVAPLCWQFPSALPLRHLFDLGFFACLLGHIATTKRRYLLGMCCAVGASLAWTIDVGVYMMVAMVFYILCLNWRLCIWAVGAAVAIGLIFLAGAQPQVL